VTGVDGDPGEPEARGPPDDLGDAKRGKQLAHTRSWVPSSGRAGSRFMVMVWLVQEAHASKPQIWDVGESEREVGSS
jgi:hypothetical protein